MRRSQSLYLVLVISIVVCCESDAQSREQPVYCYPPTVTAVAAGQVFNGRYAGGRGAAPARIGPVSCEWTTCAALRHR